MTIDQTCDAASLFDINPSPIITVKRIGQEGNCILILDQFLTYPARVRDYAIQHAQFQPGQIYPGIRHPLRQHEVEAIIDGLKPKLSTHFQMDIKATRTTFGYYSLINLKPEELSFWQTIPHYDAASSEQLAVILYLSPPDMCWGGTAFYRHRTTGFESISDIRLPSYHETYSSLKSNNQYITDSNEDYELVELIPMKYNRLIVYSGNLLHSGYLKPQMLSSDPSQGRLSLNLFLYKKTYAPNRITYYEDALDNIELDTCLVK